MSKNRQWEDRSDSESEDNLDESYDPSGSEEDDDIENESRYWRYEKAAPFSPQFASPELRRLQKERNGTRPNQSRLPPSSLFSPTPAVRIVLNRPFLDADMLHQVAHRSYRSSEKSQMALSASVEPKVLEYDGVSSVNKKKRKTASSDISPELTPVKPKRRVETASPKSSTSVSHRERNTKQASKPRNEMQSSSTKLNTSTTKPTAPAQKASNLESNDAKERIARLKMAAFSALEASRANENRQNTSSRV